VGFEALESRLCLSSVVVTGTAGLSGLVRIVDGSTGAELARMQPLGSSVAGGVRVAVGDVNADGVADFAFGAGSGRGRVVIYDGTTMARMQGVQSSFLPFGANYRGGVHLAMGDVDRDGRAELVVGADGTGRFSPMRQVRVYDVATGAVKSIFRSTDAALGRDGARRPHGGVRVAVRDMNNDGRGDVITATGRGSVQQVGVRSLGGESTGLIGGIVLNVGAGTGGVFVAATNRDPEGPPEVIVSLPRRLQLYRLDGVGGLAASGRLQTGITDASRPIGTVDINRNNSAEVVIGGLSGRLGSFSLTGNVGMAIVGATADNPFTNHFVAGTDRDAFNGMVPVAATDGSPVARLGLYNASTKAFEPVVVPVGETSPFVGKNVYVVAHGWAPDWKPAVDAYAAAHPGNFLKWWQTTDPTIPKAPSGGPASPWMFNPTYGPSNDFIVSPQGVAATIAAADPHAVVLAFSWIDDSATDSEDSAYPSEARTYRNGLRLAEALTDVLGLGQGVTLGTAGAPKVHLMGHSHGSKVATVAALALHQAGHVVEQLSVLDSPESYSTVKIDANNLLWYYLQQIEPGRTAGTTFVDNHISFLGSTYSNFPGLGNVVDVSLAPTVLYGSTDVGDNHSYAAAWYAGATAADSGYALGWSPLLHPTEPPMLSTNYEQSWTEATADTQFVLAGTSAPAPQTPVFTPSSLTDVTTTGHASQTDGVITLSTSPTSQAANLTGKLDFESVSYGLVFTFEFTNATAGDQLSVTIGGVIDNYQYFVIDGASAGSGTHTATVSVYSSWGGKYAVAFALSSTSGTTNPSVTIRDIKQITFAS
jgi:hypothetical protein